MTRKILLIGASIEVVTAANQRGIEISGIVDRDQTAGGGVPVIGDDSFLLQNKSAYLNHELVITVDDCAARDRLYLKYKAEGFTFGSILFGEVSPLAVIGEGCLIMPGSRVSDRSTLSANCRLNFDALIGHDNVIGRSTILAPRAVLLGRVRIGERTYIGANSTVCPNVTVEQDAFISAGSTVANDLKKGMQVIGYYPLPRMHQLIPRSAGITPEGINATVPLRGEPNPADSKIREIILTEFKSALLERGVNPSPDVANDLVLLQSGLNSLGFAILITSLEDRLGYDPFTLMEEPVYPRTFGEFVGMYLKYSDHLA